MEEMDHESSVNVDVEELTTSVNVYGSPVAARGQRNEELVASTSYAVPLVNVNRVVSAILHFPRELQYQKSFLKNLRLQCSCKNLCTRKKTAKTAGCPRKNALMKCSSSCTCGTKKTVCKNKTVKVVVNRNPSAFSRHQE